MYPQKSETGCENLFHVPAAWTGEQALKTLSSIFEEKTHRVPLDVVKKQLSTLGYASDDLTMVHDYARFLLCDLLAENNVPFISRADIAGSETLLQMFDNKIPDIVVKSGGPQRPKPTILDFFIGTSEQEEKKKRRKYHRLQLLFQSEILTLDELTKPLKTVLPRPDIYYFIDQVHTFHTQYEKWHSCLQSKQDLLVDSAKARIHSPTLPSPEYEPRRSAFREGLEQCWNIILAGRARL